MTESRQPFELVERARSGDRAAFDELARELSPSLLAGIRRRIGPALREKLEPEDVLQETLLRGLQSITEFRWQGERSFERWLAGIATHFILHTARQHGLRTHLRLAHEPPVNDVTASRRQRREERFERLRRTIEQLPPAHRTVVRLARLEGLKIHEIAARIGSTPGSVRNLLFRGMQLLRESFGDTESLGLPARRLDGDESRHDR